jgi:hypothetical protein
MDAEGNIGGQSTRNSGIGKGPDLGTTASEPEGIAMRGGKDV